MGNLHVERVYMLATIGYWAVCAEKTWIRNRLNAAFLCLGAAIVVSGFLSPYNPGINLTVENWLKIAVFYVLVMSTVRDERQLKILVTAFLICMALYMAHSLREFLCGRYRWMMGVRRMVGVDGSLNNPNSFGATVDYALPMVYAAWALVRNRWQRLFIISYIVLSVTCILLTGSRSAFVGLVTLACLAAIASKHRMRFAVFACVAAPVLWASLRADLQNRYLTLIDPSCGPKNAEISAKDRKRSFFEGIDLWKEHPVTGVGLGSAANATASGVKMFNLYGQVLGELGTLGALAMFLVIGGLLRNGLDMRRLTRYGGAEAVFPGRVSTAVLVTLLLLLLLGWGVTTSTAILGCGSARSKPSP